MSEQMGRQSTEPEVSRSPHFDDDPMVFHTAGIDFYQ